MIVNEDDLIAGKAAECACGGWGWVDGDVAMCLDCGEVFGPDPDDYDTLGVSEVATLFPRDYNYYGSCGCEDFPCCGHGQ